jgi:hypothetical protein
VAEYAQLLRLYRIVQVRGDKFAGGFHADEWKRNGIVYKACDDTTSENYLAALPLLLSGRVRLVDNEVLRQQLVGLERRVHTSGRESVSHAQAASAHDDVAAAACGALVTAVSGPPPLVIPPAALARARQPDRRMIARRMRAF